MVRNMNTDELVELTQLFEYFDNEKTGFINADDILNAFRANGQTIANHEMQSNFYIRNYEKFDVPKPGKTSVHRLYITCNRCLKARGRRKYLGSFQNV